MCVNNEMMPGIITYSPIARPLYCAFRWLPIISYLARQLPDLMAAFLPRALLGFVVSKLSRVVSREVPIVKYTFSQAPFLIEIHYGATSEHCFGFVPRLFDAKFSSRSFHVLPWNHCRGICINGHILILLSHERDVWSKCTVGQLRAWMLYYGCPMIGKGLSNQWVQTKLYFVEP